MSGSFARRLAEAGAAVVVNGHGSRENVDRTVSEMETAGGRAVGVMADVSEPAQVAAGPSTTPSRPCVAVLIGRLRAAI